MSESRSGGGGAATQAGVNYQNRTAAWIAAHVLAERDVPAPPEWNLSHDTTLDYIRCETEQPVDDLLIGTSTGGHVFIQVKHALKREAGAASGLASVFSQFVRQFVSYREGERPAGSRPWERPLDPDRDRLVIVTGPHSPATIKEGLPSLLNRLRSLVPGQPLADAATNDPERGLLRVIRDHVVYAWRDVLGVEPMEDDLLELLRLVSVQILGYLRSSFAGDN